MAFSPVTAAYRTPGVYVEFQDANPQYLDVGRSDIAGFLGMAERGPLHRALKIESQRQFLSAYGRASAQWYLADAINGFFANGGRTCWIVRVADPATATRAELRVQITGVQPVILRASTPGTWGNAVTIAPLVENGEVTGVEARTADGLTQTVLVAELEWPYDPDAAPRTNALGVPDFQLKDVAQPDFVRVIADNPALPLVAMDAGTPPVRLSGGANGLAALQPKHFSGDPNGQARWGIDALARAPGVSFVAAPDLVYAAPNTLPPQEFFGFGDPNAIAAAQVAIVANCIGNGNRLALLDPPRGTRQDMLVHRERLPSSSCAAVYYPWLLVDDQNAPPGTVKLLPPSGHVAGMFARVDRLRGVHKPPANEVLEGVWDLADGLDAAAHGVFNDLQINAIRMIAARGALVLGTRTLADDAQWRYVNVRRLFSMVESALEQQMQWVTFESNNPRLWREIDRSIRGFLERLFRAGMLDGTSSDDAYFIKCDDSTNPPADIDSGRVLCLIGLQPPYPAEFVVVRVGITRNGIQVQEKGAQDV